MEWVVNREGTCPYTAAASRPLVCSDSQPCARFWERAVSASYIFVTCHILSHTQKCLYTCNDTWTLTFHDVPFDIEPNIILSINYQRNISHKKKIIFSNCNYYKIPGIYTGMYIRNTLDTICNLNIRILFICCHLQYRNMIAMIYVQYLFA